MVFGREWEAKRSPQQRKAEKVTKGIINDQYIAITLTKSDGRAQQRSLLDPRSSDYDSMLPSQMRSQRSRSEIALNKLSARHMTYKALSHGF